MAAGSVAAGRLGIGLAAVAAPDLPLRWWVADDDVGRPGPRVLARALGGRDAALALGTFRAIARGGDVAAWVVAGGLADTVDAAATLAAWRHLPPARRQLVLALAGGAALTSLLAVALGLPGSARPG